MQTLLFNTKISAPQQRSRRIFYNETTESKLRKSPLVIAKTTQKARREQRARDRHPCNAMIWISNESPLSSARMRRRQVRRFVRVILGSSSNVALESEVKFVPFFVNYLFIYLFIGYTFIFLLPTGLPIFVFNSAGTD
jgi:hypothetical protein